MQQTSIVSKNGQNILQNTLIHLGILFLFLQEDGQKRTSLGEAKSTV